MGNVLALDHVIFLIFPDLGQRHVTAQGDNGVRTDTTGHSGGLGGGEVESGYQEKESGLGGHYFHVIGWRKASVGQVRPGAVWKC